MPNSIKVYNVLNNRDGSIAFIEFYDGLKCKILSKKNFEKRFEVDVQKELAS